MALFVSRWYSLCPRLHKDEGQLRAVTGWRVWLMTLGMAYREVVIDPRKRTIRVHDRVLWLFSWTRKARFERVRAVTYGYTDENSFGGFNKVRDTLDIFKVGLRLHAKGGSDEHWHLFRFMGDGSFVNDGPFPDWLYWDEYLFDVSGTQQRESRVFVDLLARMIGTEVTPP